jgi:hypothetical protein
MDVNNDTSNILHTLSGLLSPEQYDALRERIFEGESNFFPEDTKLIDCPLEIVFSINANILEQNTEGQTTGSRELCVRTYHIPIPPNKNYKEYMDAFFGFFENTLAASVEQAEQQSTNTQETSNE